MRGQFSAHAIGEPETDMTIRSLAEETGVLADPHTAVAVAAARAESGQGSWPMVVMSTAHAAKFPDAVEAACGVRPALPPRLAGPMTRPERVSRVTNDVEALKDVIGREAVR